jgi:hypothetical protein
MKTGIQGHVRRKDTRKRLLGLFKTIILLVFVMSASALAATYNAFTDFSISNGNPNGVWSYGWSTTLLSSLNLYPHGFVDGSGNLDWNDPNHVFAGAPSNFANPTNNQQGTVPAHSAAFHPGQSGEFSHYIWTAPTSGLFSLSATFSPLDTGGTDVHILEDGSSLFAGNVSPGNPQSFSTQLSLVAGDTIDFAVGDGPDGTFQRDTTGISATISNVPEPGTWAAAALGVFAVFGRIMRKMRRWQIRRRHRSCAAIYF